jgi:hypothetical protein
MVEATPQSKQCLHRHKLVANGKFASKADVGRTSDNGRLLSVAKQLAGAINVIHEQ